MSDHHHDGEYAEARHEHRGEYADERHDHDLAYAERYHRHHDDERAIEALRAELKVVRDALNEYERDLADARARQLEAEHEADVLREQRELREAAERRGQS